MHTQIRETLVREEKLEKWPRSSAGRTSQPASLRFEGCIWIPIHQVTKKQRNMPAPPNRAISIIGMGQARYSPTWELPPLALAFLAALPTGAAPDSQILHGFRPHLVIFLDLQWQIIK